MKRMMVSILIASALLASVCLAGEIGFEEDFALAKDRTVPLKQLIPGTEDYYFYHCLHYQNTGELDKVDGMLKLWIERHGRTGRVVEIENRQASFWTAEYRYRQIGTVRVKRILNLLFDFFVC